MKLSKIDKEEDRKMKKIKKTIGLFFATVFLVNMVASGNDANIKRNNDYGIEVTMFNAGGYSGEASLAQGDASVIDCGKNHYVLVDTGFSGKSSEMFVDFLFGKDKGEGSLKAAADGRIYIDAVILSHNHMDHVGGFMTDNPDENTYQISEGELLRALNTRVQKDECEVGSIYYCESGPRNYATFIKEYIGDICGYDIQMMAPGERRNIRCENAYISIFGPAINNVNDYYSEWYGDETLRTYYQISDGGKRNSFDDRKLTIKSNGSKHIYNFGSMENNCSMAVTVTNSDKSFTGVFLGDMSGTAVLQAINSSYSCAGDDDEKWIDLKYGQNKGYTFCKYGHHGQVSMDNDKFSEACDIYNRYIKASQYVITANVECIKSKSEEDTAGTESRIIKTGNLAERLISADGKNSKFTVFRLENSKEEIPGNHNNIKYAARSVSYGYDSYGSYCRVDK